MDVNHPLKVAGFDPPLPGWVCPPADTLPDRSVLSYVLLMHNGGIEAVFPDPTMAAKKLINPAYEGTLRRGLVGFLETQQRLGIRRPLMVGTSLVNIGGFQMAVPEHPFRNTVTPIKGPHLILPAVSVEADAMSVDAMLKPGFDQVWHCSGFFGSPHFDDNGCWIVGSPEI